MKTIAILTDFSERSVLAARYALHLAKKIKANVLLFNAFSVPGDSPLAASGLAWPENGYEESKRAAEKSIKALCARLQNEQDSTPGTQGLQPAIRWQCEAGPVAAALPSLENNRDIMLLVAGTHGGDAVQTFLTGNNCRQLIDAAQLPLLLIPDNAQVQDLDKIIFATDLDRGDIAYINAVAGLAEAFYAFIGIVNVDPEVPSDARHNQKVNAFMQDMVLRGGYRRVDYRNFPDAHVNKGLTAVLEKEQPDLLVMIHRKSTVTDLFKNPSHTQKIAKHAAFPLLVYPFPMTIIPAFCIKRRKPEHIYYHYYRVDQHDTAIRQISVNDFRPVRTGRITGPLFLQPGSPTYWLFTDIGRAMEKAKAEAQAYIGQLIARGEEGGSELLQYRIDHYEDLNINLVETNVEKQEREMLGHSDFQYKPYKINPDNISDDYK